MPLRCKEEAGAVAYSGDVEIPSSRTDGTSGIAVDHRFLGKRQFPLRETRGPS